MDEDDEDGIFASGILQQKVVETMLICCEEIITGEVESVATEFICNIK